MNKRTAEQIRLDEDNTGAVFWKRWGPYVSERAWGTVREDYSPGGDSWDFFTHDHARSRAYRWGEDGIAGISDDEQRLCLSLALGCALLYQLPRPATAETVVFLLLVAIPYLVVLAMLLWPGERKTNHYGPPQA